MVSRRDLGAIGASALAAGVLASEPNVANAQSAKNSSVAGPNPSGAPLSPRTSSPVARLDAIRGTVAYNLQAIDREIEALSAKANPTTLDNLAAEGFILSYAGMNNDAINTLRAVVSQKEGRTSRTLGKLAQILTRRNANDDAENAISLSLEALKTASTTDERWLANHNLAIASLQLNKSSDAKNFAEAALNVMDDPRSRMVLEIASALHGVPGANARTLVQSLQARGIATMLSLQADHPANTPQTSFDPKSYVYLASFEMAQ